MENRIAIRYYTRTENTKKLADAIANSLGIEARTVKEPIEEPVDILFLGTSVYAFGIDESVRHFIRSLDKTKVKKIAVFSTSAMLELAAKDVRSEAKNVGIEVCEQDFYCRGQFLMMHKGRPNNDDFDAIRLFAKRIVDDIRSGK